MYKGNMHRTIRRTRRQRRSRGHGRNRTHKQYTCGVNGRCTRVICIEQSRELGEIDEAKDIKEIEDMRVIEEIEAVEMRSA